MTNKRVLLIAEAANPEWTSVPLVGWSLAKALSETFDTHLVTQVRNRDAISRQGWIEGREFTAIDTEGIAAPAHRLSTALRLGKGTGWTINTTIASLTYPYFERKVWKRFGHAIEAGEYDLVHRVTPVSPTAPSPLASRCRKAGIPFILGPINGGVPWPKGFDRERRREREYLSYIRDLYKMVPGRNRALADSSAIICGSRHTMSEIPEKYRDKTFWLPENAIWPELFGKRIEPTGTPTMRGCFIGRLVPYKGPDMLLEAALPLLADGRLKLDIVGDGPLMPDLKAFVARHGISDGVTFHGWVEHSSVQDIAVHADLLTFPSIREFGGGVVVETMALGVVPMIVDYAGPGELVSPQTGIKIPIGSREDIVRGFRKELEDLANHPGRLPALSQAARETAHTLLTWPAKARQIGEIYEWTTGVRPQKPAVLIGNPS